MNDDPFEDMMEKMKRMMEEGATEGGRSISVRRTGDQTTVDVSGDVSDEKIERLKEKYPDAEIRIDGEEIEEGPIIEVIDEEE